MVYFDKTILLRFQTLFQKKKIIIIISFTLYPTHNRVGSGNLVLIYSVPHFPPSSQLQHRTLPRHQSEWHTYSPYDDLTKAIDTAVNVAKYWKNRILIFQALTQRGTILIFGKRIKNLT